MPNKDRETFMSIVGRIEYILKVFEDNNMDERIIKIFLTNGDYLEYNVSKESVAHLLGVNTINLIATGIITNKNAYEALKELCEKKYLISSMIVDKNLTINSIFSNYTNQKLDYFFENIKININDTDFVCKYDKNIAINNGVVDPHKCQYIVCRKNNEHTFLILHLVKNKSKYIPMSNRIFNTLEEAIEYFEATLSGQEITYINSLINKQSAFDEGKKIYLNHSDKRNHLLILKDYAQSYNSNINILSDYEYTLKASEQNVEKNIYRNIIIDTIIECIAEGKPIIEGSIDFDIPYNYKPLIDAINQLLVNKSETRQEEIENLIAAKTEIEMQLQRANERISQLEDTIDTIGKLCNKQKTLKPLN